MPSHDVIGALSREPRLLTALFEINGETFRIIVDTGATTSFIPELGRLMKSHQLRLLSTNLNVHLADNGIRHIDKKILVTLRPKGSKDKPKEAVFYVSNGAEHILGHEALLGLNHLKLFNLQIQFDKNVRIYHDGRCIGEECDVPYNYKASVKVDTRFDDLKLEDNLSKTLKKYKQVFTDIDALPIHGQPMRILTTHQRPIFSKQRHYNADEIIQMKTHIKSLLDKGIIEPTTSGHAATSRIIPKKNGAGRLVVNYIPLNAVTLRDSYTLPHVPDILNILQGKKYFTTMDCAQGFYQILVDKRDRHKTAFSTPIGNFQFVRCPFGARNSCAVFQSEMNRIFADGLYTKCVIYVDDILVFGKDREEHDANLAWVLKKCKTFNVKIKLEKCHFAQTKVNYLGLSITGDTIEPPVNKIESLCKSKPPSDKTELRSIIGKLNFYARFIPNYSKHLGPLRELFRKNKDFQWRPHHQQAYEGMLNALQAPSTQLLVPRGQEKILELHIMQDSLEAVCLDTKDSIICRWSRLLSPTESNYSNIEKQLLAMVLSIKKFKIWLEPERFLIRVPSRNLEKTLQLVNRPERIESLLLKMPEGYDNFRFEVKESLSSDRKKALMDHVPQEIFYTDGASKRNGKPDCKASWAVCAEFNRELELTGDVLESPSNQTAELTAVIKACEKAKELGLTEITIKTDSKYVHSAATVWIDKWLKDEWKDNKKKPVINTSLFKQLVKAKDGLQIEWIHVKGHGDDLGNIRADTLARARLDSSSAVLAAVSVDASQVQEGHAEIDQLKEQINEGRKPELVIGEDGGVYFVDSRLPEENQRRIYVPTDARYYLLNLAHDDKLSGGHLGIKKTHRKLIRFWWPKMHRDVEHYIKSCDVCQRLKNPAGLPPGYLNSIPVSAMFQHVHIDIVGPVHTTCRGNSYVITATDAFSKFCFARPCQNIRTSEIIKFLEECIFSIHGKPEVIISDRGTQFTSAEWKDFIEKVGAKHNLTTPFHPQSNGIDERVNGTVVNILKPYIDHFQDNWDEQLKWAIFVYNTTVHESTGYSPYQIAHGLDPRLPLRGQVNNRSTDLPALEKIRSLVRSRANNSNTKSQEKGKENYDSHRRNTSIQIGDLMLIKEHVAPTYLSKKFYHKWYGPAVVIGFVGDPTKPKAIKVMDCSTTHIKVVAIQDLKPYHKRDASLIGKKFSESTGEPKSDTLVNEQDAENDKNVSKEKSDAPDPVDQADLYRPEYFVEPPSKEPQTPVDTAPDTSAQQKDCDATIQPTIDLATREEGYPITSSPKHVTINEEPTTHTYEPTTLEEQNQAPVLKEPEQGPSHISPYQVDFIVDDPGKDPHFIAPAFKQQVPTDRVLRKNPTQAKRSLIPVRISATNPPITTREIENSATKLSNDINK